jgi:tripartite-type tricarboxylate transporter receptor subunit TctC
MEIFSRTVVLALCAVADLSGFSGQAGAQAWPGSLVKIVVPFPPGGPTDIVARLISTKLADRIGKTVIVENKPGADGNLGAQYVAQSPADGNTLLFVVPAIITNRFFQKNAADMSGELQPVIALNRVPNILLVKPSLNVSSVEDLAKLVQSKDNDVSCASSGSLPTMGCELFKARTKGNIIMVRYKGNAPALAALSTGEVSMLFDVANTAAEAVKAGRAKALATTNTEAMGGVFTGLPMMKDKYAGFDLVAWQGLMAPKAAPKAAVDAANAAINEVLKDPDIRKAFDAAALIPVGGSAEAFGKLMNSDNQKYTAVVKDAGIQPE